MKLDILYLGKFPDATVSELHRRYHVHHFSPMPQADVITAEMGQRIRGIATEANHGLTRALLDRMPNVEVISVFGVGTDAVDLKAAKERGIPVTNTPDIIGPEVADLAIGNELACHRELRQIAELGSHHDPPITAPGGEQDALRRHRR